MGKDKTICGRKRGNERWKKLRKSVLNISRFVYEKKGKQRLVCPNTDKPK